MMLSLQGGGRKLEADWARPLGPRGLPVTEGVCRDPGALVYKKVWGEVLTGVNNEDKNSISIDVIWLG